MRPSKETLDKIKEKTLPLRAPLEALAMFGGLFIALIPLMLIIINGNKLGRWWIVLAVIYLTIFITITAFLIRRKHLDHLHYVMGDEMFYARYPRELKRDRRKKERYNAQLERIKRKKQEKEEAER